MYVPGFRVISPLPPMVWSPFLLEDLIGFLKELIGKGIQKSL